MKKLTSIIIGITLILAAGCSKPLASAKVAPDIQYASRSYAANANDIYYATKWALQNVGMPIATENLQDGIITTDWVPVSSDSHYVDTFGRPDFGVTNSYHQLEIQISPSDGRTEVKVGSRAKTLVARFKSSGIMERKVLDGIGNYLRKGEPEVTNLGVDE